MATVTEVRPAIYILLGCPGAGKGTFAQAIISDRYEHISTGDITREEIKKETEFGLKYKEAILNHVMGGIPFEEIQKLVEQRLENAWRHQKGVILDGYPKTLEQCKFLDSFIQKKELKDRAVVVFLEVNEEDVIDRILCRQTCSKCNRVYNSRFAPAKNAEECDDCHIKLTQRLDANIESTKKRVREFRVKVEEVMQYYSSSNRLNVLDANSPHDACLEKFLRFHLTLSTLSQ